MVAGTRRTWSHHIAALVGALVILAACSTPDVWGRAEPGAQSGGSDLPPEWPDGLLGRLLDGDGAYAWQLCRFDADGTATLGMVGAVSPSDGRAVSLSRASDVDRVVIEAGAATVSVRGGPWQPSDDERLVDIELAPLRTVDGVSALFDLEATVVDPADRSTEHRLVEPVPTGDGGPTLRLEGQSDGWLVGPQSDDAVAARQRLSPVPLVVWLLDAWADGDRVERIRYQRQAWSPLAVELRLLPIEEAIVDGVLQQPACRTGMEAAFGGWRGFEPWVTDRAPLLRVTLDPDGRPYDEALRPGSTMERETIGTIAAPAGELLVMDGNAIQVDPSFFADESVRIEVAPERVDEDGVHVVNVDVIWERWPAAVGGARGRSVLGVWIGPTDAPVEAWDPFELAYGTDGGVGGVIPRSVIALAEELDDEWWIDHPDFGPDYELLDLDDIPGTETLVFVNGSGDGAFPLARGRDADGQVVAVLIWRTGAPWRLAAPSGRPPADVIEREEELLECIAGARPVDVFGACE